ncbi:Retrovirus-related Pol polyprotein, partial [Mucuna pruriens]
MVSERGIKIDSDKVRAIQEMPASSMQKEVRGFLGRLNYIARFISQLTTTCYPIFKLLRKSQKTEWNEECQEAFEKIKQYFERASNPRTPSTRKAPHNESMGCVLAQHDDFGRKEQAIYYLSKKFIDYEIRYSPLERMCCALTWAA